MDIIKPNDRFSGNLTEQQVFDLGVQYLGTLESRVVKKIPGVSDENCICVYRTEDGRTCAAGYFLAPEEYKITMEGKSLFQDEMQKIWPNRLKTFNYILIRLQGIHDSQENWRDNRKNMKSLLLDAASSFVFSDKMIEHPDMAWNKKASS